MTNFRPDKQNFTIVAMQSTKYSKTELFILYVDSELQEIFGDFFCLDFRYVFCVYISTN